MATDGVRLVTEPGLINTPGGGYGFRFFDNEGRTVEISADVAIRRHRAIEAGESIPVRLSHVVINSPKPDETRAFYERHLGFRLSDTLMHPRMGEMMWFMRINAWHHSLAIARGPHPSLHHASFEMRDIDSYMRGTGRLLRAGVEKIWGPGRHMAGNNTFSYFLDPHGNTIEYTTELELIDEDTWHPHLYDFTRPEVSDQWGTANQMNEFVASRSFNDVDKGLFVAPPVWSSTSCDSPPSNTHGVGPAPGSSPTRAAGPMLHPLPVGYDRPGPGPGRAAGRAGRRGCGAVGTGRPVARRPLAAAAEPADGPGFRRVRGTRRGCRRLGR